MCSKEEMALKPLQTLVLCTTISAVSDDLLVVVVVVICFKRVSVELIFVEIVGNVGWFVIHIDSRSWCLDCCQLLLAILEGARQFV